MCIWGFPLNLIHPNVMFSWCHFPKIGQLKFKAVDLSQILSLWINNEEHNPSLNLSVNNSEVKNNSESTRPTITGLSVLAKTRKN